MEKFSVCLIECLGMRSRDTWCTDQEHPYKDHKKQMMSGRPVQQAVKKRVFLKQNEKRYRHLNAQFINAEIEKTTERERQRSSKN